MKSITRNHGVILAATLLSLLLGTSWAAGTKIYKWTDEDGNVIYSQTPPPRGIDVKKIKEAPPPPVNPNDAMGDLRKRADEFSKRRDERLEVEAKGEEAAAEAKRQREICAQLRKNLAGLQSTSQARVKGEDGQLSVIGEDSRQQKIKATQQRIQQECSSQNSQ